MSTEVPDYPPDDPYAGQTCNLTLPGMEHGENATISVESYGQGYCTVTARIDGERFAELKFTDHQFRRLIDAYMAGDISPDHLKMFKNFIAEWQQH